MAHEDTILFHNTLISGPDNVNFCLVSPVCNAVIHGDRCIKPCPAEVRRDREIIRINRYFYRMWREVSCRGTVYRTNTPKPKRGHSGFPRLSAGNGFGGP